MKREVVTTTIEELDDSLPLGGFPRKCITAVIVPSDIEPTVYMNALTAYHRISARREEGPVPVHVLMSREIDSGRIFELQGEAVERDHAFVIIVGVNPAKHREGCNEANSIGNLSPLRASMPFSYLEASSLIIVLDAFEPRTVHLVKDRFTALPSELMPAIELRESFPWLAPIE